MNIRRTASILILTLLLTTKIIYCQAEVERIAQLLEGWSSISDVEVQGDYAYLTTRDTGLKVINVSNPEEPVCVGECILSGSAYYLVLNNNLLYVASRYKHGLSIVDISDPENPQEIGFIDDNQEKYSSCCLKIFNGLAFFNNMIIDISEPDRPSIISVVPILNSPVDVALNGNWLYYLDGSYGLKVYDVSNRRNPSMTSTCPFRRGYMKSMRISGNHSFIAAGDYGIKIVDITNPRDPHQVGEYDEESFNANDLEIRDDTLYVIGANDFRTINVSEPTEPQPISSCDAAGTQMIIQDDIAYIAGFNYDPGLHILDISDSGNPSEIGQFSKNLRVQTIGVEGQYAYAVGVIPNGQYGWSILDISQPDSPETVSIYESSIQARSIKIRDEFAFITTYEHGLVILNISTPDSIYETGRFEFDNAFHLSLNDSLAFITTEVFDERHRTYVYYGMHIINYSDPENLHEIFANEAPIHCTAVSDNALFVSYVDRDNNLLQIFDISDPSNPELISEYQTPEFIEDIAVSGNLCFIAVGESGICILDITNPAEPRAIGFFNTPGLANKIRIEEDHLFVSDYINDHINRFLVFDVSDPTHPSEVGYTNLPREIWDFTVSDGIAYLAELYILEIYDCNPVLSAEAETINYPSAFRLYPAYPNPFNNQSIIHFEIPNSGFVNISVFNVNGRNLNNSLTQFQQAGRNSFIINGDELPSGYYLLRVGFNGESKAQKITLIK
ncbi:T9SS type A sorting domain-containing protein [bacterium]|nr:T9SS type A sorting domain-containing protein [bacterium]